MVGLEFTQVEGEMRLNVDMNAGLYYAFSDFCKDEGRTRSEVVRSLISEWIDKRREFQVFINKNKEMNDERRRKED